MVEDAIPGGWSEPVASRAVTVTADHPFSLFRRHHDVRMKKLNSSYRIMPNIATLGIPSTCSGSFPSIHCCTARSPRTAVHFPNRREHVRCQLRAPPRHAHCLSVHSCLARALRATVPASPRHAPPLSEPQHADHCSAETDRQRRLVDRFAAAARARDRAGSPDENS